MTCCIDVAMGIELQGYLSTFHTLHVLLGDLFEAMVQGLPLQASLFTQPCRDNTLYLLALVDELVMRDAFRILPVSPFHLFFSPPSFISMTTFRCMCARMDLSSCSWIFQFLYCLFVSWENYGRLGSSSSMSFISSAMDSLSADSLDCELDVILSSFFF